MFNNVDFALTKGFSLASIGSYTLGKAFSAAAELKDTWHFQALQELAFAAAIVSSIVAIFTFHQNYLKNKRKSKKKDTE